MCHASSENSHEPPVNGKIATTFRFREGGFDGPEKTYKPTGFVRQNTGNAVWGMQFVWPIKAEYRILFVDEDYATTIIGRSKRDYVWIMARSPDISESDYRTLVSIIEAEGYDVEKLRRVPHNNNDPA
jgi:apolipoprotein D and lipocalin family protein